MTTKTKQQVKAWAILHDNEILMMSPQPNIFHELSKETAEEEAGCLREESGREISVVPAIITFNLPKKK